MQFIPCNLLHFITCNLLHFIPCNLLLFILCNLLLFIPIPCNHLLFIPCNSLHFIPCNCLHFIHCNCLHFIPCNCLLHFILCNYLLFIPCNCLLCIPCNRLLFTFGSISDCCSRRCLCQLIPWIIKKCTALPKFLLIFCKLITSIFCILFLCKAFTPLLGSSHPCRQPWRNSGKVALKPVQPHSRTSSAKLSHNYGAEPVRTKYVKRIVSSNVNFVRSFIAVIVLNNFSITWLSTWRRSRLSLDWE